MAAITVVGNFVVDIIGKPIDRLPDRGRLLLIDTLETHVGGNAPNAAGALAKLGAEAAVIGRVGDDLYGRFMLEKLAGWGVETSCVVRDRECATGVTLVAVDASGERSFIHHFGANARFGPADVPPEALAGSRHLHLASFFVLPALDGVPAAGLLRRARERGLTTSLDACWDRTGRWMELLSPCLPHVDYLMPSEEEARELTGRTEPAEMARAFQELGARTVVIKRGGRGCFYSAPEGELSVPAFEVEVRDATGAGDCFIAGFLYARSRGWELERTLRFANACGALSVQQVGAVSGLPDAAGVSAWAAGADKPASATEAGAGRPASGRGEPPPPPRPAAG
jgi:sugar/nucleoside kinase (ribokinase family)